MKATADSVTFNGIDIELGKLKKNVVTCMQAATAKKISLENELKSLFLDTGKGFYMLHLPGDKRVNFRAVKKYLKTKRVQLAKRDALDSFNCQPGTINPFSNEKLKSLPHLISKEVFEKNMLSTNYGGTLRVYIKFHPELLDIVLEEEHIHIGRFAVDEN